jgi:hypothetical protein
MSFLGTVMVGEDTARLEDLVVAELPPTLPPDLVVVVALLPATPIDSNSTTPCILAIGVLM